VSVTILSANFAIASKNNKNLLLKKLLLFLILGILAFGITNADDGNIRVDETSSTTLTLKKNNGRPNAPARYFIECEYSNAFIKFKFPSFVDGGDVEIENEDGIAFQSYVSAANPAVTLPSLTGTYIIRCTTDGGAIYEGTITL
jgi:hypothetical protein